MSQFQLYDVYFTKVNLPVLSLRSLKYVSLYLGWFIHSRNFLDGCTTVTAVVICRGKLSPLWSVNPHQYPSFASLSSNLSAVRFIWHDLKAEIRSSVRASALRLFLHSFSSSTAVSSSSVGCFLEMDSSFTSVMPSLRPSLRQDFPRFSEITSVAICSLAERVTEDTEVLEINIFQILWDKQF